MPLKVSLRQLEKGEQTLAGELPVEDLDLMLDAEVMRSAKPLRYELEAQILNDAVLVRGSLRLDLECDCVRCLKRFINRIELGDWACLIPLVNEESDEELEELGEKPVVIVDDSVDLTPFLREDILLTLLQHPLCEPECRGMKSAPAAAGKKPAAEQPDEASPAWAALDKLKIRKE